jgi:hypothetical protein
MILHLTRTTATLVGENAAEWERLEQAVRAGHRTTCPRREETRLRALTAALRVELKIEEDSDAPPRRGPRRGTGGHASVRRPR